MLSQSVEREETLVEKVIYEASLTFKSGLYTNIEFMQKIVEEDLSDLQVRDRYYYPQYRDTYFPIWDANRIEGTNFVAASGPVTQQDIGSMITSTVFNSHISIKHIVALGNKLTNRKCKMGEANDFYDYCLGSGETQFGIYPVTIQQISGTFKADDTNYGFQQIPTTIIQSTLTIRPSDHQPHAKDKTLGVTLIPLKDHTAFDLVNKAAPHIANETKELLWQLYQKSLQEPILVHCRGGLGRTGHFILTLEILKNYETLFASQDPKIIAVEIHKVLNRIRKNRPALLLVDDQFNQAIENADIIHHYALSKGYIQKPVAHAENLRFFTQKPIELDVNKEGQVSVNFRI